MEHVNQKAAAHISELGMQMQELLAYVTPQMEKLYNENVITNEQGELFLAEKTFGTSHNLSSLVAFLLLRPQRLVVFIWRMRQSPM